MKVNNKNDLKTYILEDKEIKLIIDSINNKVFCIQIDEFENDIEGTYGVLEFCNKDIASYLESLDVDLELNNIKIKDEVLDFNL